MAKDKIGKNRKLLWSNSSGEWGTGEIVLSSSDYEFLEVVFKPTNGSTSPRCVQKFAKGTNCNIFYANVSNGVASDTFIMQRNLTRNSDTSFTPTLGKIARWGSTSGGEATGQTYFIYPIAIYGIS